MLRELRELLPPPARPYFADGDWGAVEQAIGSRLPADYRLFGPQEFGAVPKELTLDVSYTDLKGIRFAEKQSFDFAFFGVPGSGERGVDISRQNNDPVVRQLKEIAEALAAKKSASFRIG